MSNQDLSIFSEDLDNTPDENEEFDIEIAEEDSATQQSDNESDQDADQDANNESGQDADHEDIGDDLGDKDTQDADGDTAQDQNPPQNQNKKRRRNKVPARKRIRELVDELRKVEDEKNEWVQKASEAAQKAKELEEQMTGVTQRSLTSRIEGNKARTTQLEAEIQEAQERGDFATATKKFSELADLKAETSTFSQYLQQIPSTQTDDPVTPSPATPQNQEYRDTPATQAATALWQDEHDWFELNELGQPVNEESAIAQQAFNQLFAANPQVYYTNPNGFYETLDRVLQNLDKTKHVYSKSKPKQKPSQSVISGAPAGTQAGSGKQRRKVTLTREQLNIASELGLTPEQYAASLLRQKG